VLITLLNQSLECAPSLFTLHLPLPPYSSPLASSVGQAVFKNTKVETRSALRRVRFLETVRPALEKTRSEAADDAGTASHLRATKDSKGYSAALSLHHSKGLPCSCSAPSLLLLKHSFSCSARYPSSSMSLSVTASAQESSSSEASGSTLRSTLNLDAFAAAAAATAAANVG
jgi:hypothetical protein